MDVHVRLEVTRALVLRSVDVLTAQEDGAARMTDPQLLDRASALGRVLFTQDEDFLREATRRQNEGEPFLGVIYAHQRNITVGECINDLELIAKVMELDEFASRVLYLPLQ